MVAPWAYYNELDPKAAAWLRELIREGVIAPGDVDDRSILDVSPVDLIGYTQCHFFAGIGVWSYALRRADWPDDRPVWTGSCPCQPFSAAGKKGGFDDERHLWPSFFKLIAAHRPVAVFGEQVASNDGLAWLDLVCSDLEGADYACWPVDLCAAGVGAPHIRQRLWWVADTSSERRQQERGSAPCDEEAHGRARRNGGEPNGNHTARCDGQIGVLADDNERGRALVTPARLHDRWQSGHDVDRCGESSVMGDATGRGLGMRGRAPGEAGWSAQPEPVSGFWRNAEWLPCIDGKARPVEPGTFPLAHGAPARVGRLRGYGNAINAEAAAAVIGAYLTLQ